MTEVAIIGWKGSGVQIRELTMPSREPEQFTARAKRERTLSDPIAETWGERLIEERLELVRDGDLVRPPKQYPLYKVQSREFVRNCAYWSE